MGHSNIRHYEQRSIVEETKQRVLSLISQGNFSEAVTIAEEARRELYQHRPTKRSEAEGTEFNWAEEHLCGKQLDSIKETALNAKCHYRSGPFRHTVSEEEIIGDARKHIQNLPDL